MITLYMSQKDNPVIINEGAFSTETGVLVLEISLGDYSLTGKIITAVFSQTAVETAPLTVSNGLIQLPITLGLLVAGENKIQLNIREGLTLEQSPIMKWSVGLAVAGTDSVPTNVDIITWLLADSSNINVMYPPYPLVAVKGDGVTDDTTALNNIISAYRNVYIPDGNYKVTGSLLVQGLTTDGGIPKLFNGKHITMGANARILQYADADVFVVRGSSNTLEGGIIDCSPIGSGFTKSGILCEAIGTGNDQNCYNNFDKIRLNNYGKMFGRGITLKASGSAYIYYNRFTDFHVEGFYYGIYFDNTSTNGINNNYFNGDINAAQQTMYIVGAGNIFLGNHQATTLDTNFPELACIYLKGGSNQFYCFVHDAGGSGLVKYQYELDGTHFNIISGNVSVLFIKNNVATDNTNKFLLDDGRKNKKIILPFKGYSEYGHDYYAGYSQLEEYWTRYYMVSPINNTLANKTRITSIAVDTVDCELNALSNMTDLNDLLNHNSYTRLGYSAVTPVNGGTLDLNITLTADTRVNTLGLLTDNLFSNKCFIQCFIKLSDGADYIEVPNIINTLTDPVANQYSDCSVFDILSLSLSLTDARKIRYIKFQMTIPPNATVTNGYVPTLYYLYANFSDTGMAGSGYPYIGGDTFTGDINFSTNSTLKFGATTSLPEANSTNRGRTLRIEGASGSDDKLYLCAKLKDNSYVWKSVGMEAGTTAQRPTTSLYVGQVFFDSTLSIPIWIKTVAGPVWVDATGTTV